MGSGASSAAALRAGVAATSQEDLNAAFADLKPEDRARLVRLIEQEAKPKAFSPPMEVPGISKEEALPTRASRLPAPGRPRSAESKKRNADTVTKDTKSDASVKEPPAAAEKPAQERTESQPAQKAAPEVCDEKKEEASVEQTKTHPEASLPDQAAEKSTETPTKKDDAASKESEPQKGSTDGNADAPAKQETQADKIQEVQKSSTEIAMPAVDEKTEVTEK